MKTREEVRALTRTLSCTCRSYEFSQDSTETTTCRKQSVGWVLLGGGVLRRARRGAARTRESLPHGRFRGKRPRGSDWIAGRERPATCDVRRSTADGRDVGGRTSNVERPERGEPAARERGLPERRPVDITTESTESTEGPDARKARSGEGPSRGAARNDECRPRRSRAAAFSRRVAGWGPRHAAGRRARRRAGSGRSGGPRSCRSPSCRRSRRPSARCPSRPARS